MKTNLNLFMLFAFIACAAAPKKDFKTIQYLPEEGACFDRILPNNEIETLCHYSNGTNSEKDWIAIRKSSFNKELNYQNLLIKKCKVWKD